MLKNIVRKVMEKEKKYFKDIRKKVDIFCNYYFYTIIISSLYMLYERKILNQREYLCTYGNTYY